ncbi:MAG: alpha/beta hydrolase [Alphaproteobacteria bacterium]|nr:alpha/beta hydrolase [Alphaproteobacteria bacterium]MCL2505059.1 alpha/beta hydrolase [Alphaproteobacteria bacterium]
MPEVFFSGSAGRLEGRYNPGKSPDSPIALILHPYPQHGGTMNNKVVYTMYSAFVEKGFATLRFNFRGVGKSQGCYDRGEGELSDAASAIDWLQAMNPNTRNVWIAGFSFGAWIALQLLMRRPEVDSFVAVSPPTNMLDFNFLTPCPVSGQIIHGGMDDIVPEPFVSKMVHKLSSQKGINIDYKVIPTATHFFTENLFDISNCMRSYLEQAVQEPPLAKSA